MASPRLQLPFLTSLFLASLALTSSANPSVSHSPVRPYSPVRASLPGTTEHLQQIFTGRCYAGGGTLCDELWEEFSHAFRYQQDFAVTPDYFKSFFNRSDVSASLKAPTSKGLFWSGVSALFDMSTLLGGEGWFVMEISGVAGWLQGTDFCGSPTAPNGMNSSECIYGDVSPQDNQWHGTWVSFWAEASRIYATQVRGDINVVLTGRLGHPAYRRDSFFGSIELGALRVDQIGGITISVLPQAIDQPLFERCGHGSLQLLVEDLVSLGFKQEAISCNDAPDDLLIYMCTRDPKARRCKLKESIPFNNSERLV